MYKTILLDVNERVATITLNRPAQGNAFGPESYDEIPDALKACAQNDEVGAIIITGAGRFFSAGGDIGGFRTLIDNGTYIPTAGAERAGKMAIAVRNCPKPVIAMVNGAAAGAGLGLALACDLRVVDEKTAFICAFSNLGLPGDTLTQYMLAKLIGPGKTAEMMMNGKPVVGAKLVEMGLACKCAAEGNLAETAMKLAKFYAARPTAAIARQKEYYNRFIYDRMGEVVQFEGEGMHACSKSADFNEAVNAFLEKRPAVFTGK